MACPLGLMGTVCLGLGPGESRFDNSGGSRVGQRLQSLWEHTRSTSHQWGLAGPTQREVETGTSEKTNSKHLGSGPEQENRQLGRGRSCAPWVCAPPEQVSPPRPRSGDAFILKRASFALAAARTARSDWKQE